MGFDFLSGATDILPPAPQAATDLMNSLNKVSDAASGGFLSIPGVSATCPAPSNDGSNGLERLFTARPRSAADQVQGMQGNTGYAIGRGPHAFIRLLTSNDQASSYLYGGPVSRGSGKSDAMLSASLKKMVSGDPNNADTRNGAKSGYDSFLLTGVSANLSEKTQIVTTFGDNEVIYYFGRNPIAFNISGTLIDSVDNDWFTEWIVAYAGALRGTELARNYELLRIVLPNMTIDGSISNVSWDQTSNSDVSIPFSFTFLVKTLVPTPVIPVNFPWNSGAALIHPSGSAGSKPQSSISSLKDQIAGVTSVLTNPLSSQGDIASAMLGLGTGVSGAMGVRASSSAVSNFLDGLNSQVMGVIGSGTLGSTGLFSSLATSLNGIRASIFSPIYGVMNSLTKLVSNVMGGVGVSSIFDSLVNPIRGMLQDVSNIANMAKSVGNIINNGISGLGRGITTGFGLGSNASQAMKSIRGATGVFSSIPTTVSMSLKWNYNSGYIAGTSSFLQSNPKFSISKSVSSLSSGGSAGLSTQKAILSYFNTAAQGPGASL